VRALELGELAGELGERVGVPEPADEVVEGAVADEVAAGQRLHRESDGDVALADPGRAEDEAADFSFDEAQRAQLGEALGVELGLECDVELVEGLVVRQAGHLQPGLVAAAFEDSDFGLQEQVEELAVAELGGLGALDQLVWAVGDRVQAQLGGVAADPLGDQLSRRSGPDRPTAAGGAPPDRVAR
jgi:hypothetical protein